MHLKKTAIHTYRAKHHFMSDHKVGIIWYKWVCYLILSRNNISGRCLRSTNKYKTMYVCVCSHDGVIFHHTDVL